MNLNGIVMKNIWDERYKGEKFVYGENPNNFFKETIDSLPVGKILLPGDGEGRNSVYAAKEGWGVDAFDQSIEARNKALSLADRTGVNIVYHLLDFNDILSNYPSSGYDAVALLYLHFPSDIKAEYLMKIPPLLKDGGLIIFEAFAKKHISNQKENLQAGGPRDIDMLFSEQELRQIFKDMEFLSLKEEDVLLNEGEGHNGKASVINFVARKRSI